MKSSISPDDKNDLMSVLPVGFKEGSLLPAAVCMDKKKLSAHQKEIINSLKGDNPWCFFKTILLNWVIILSVISGAVYINNFFVTVLAIIIIATRQNVFGLLIHDQAHRLGLSSSLGDGIANLLAGWPLLVLSVESYAKVHITHHAYYFTKHDPDFIRKNGRDWSIPIKGRVMLKILLKDIFAMNLIETIQSKKIDMHKVKREPYFSIWWRIAYYLFFAGLFTYYGLWSIFFIYWVIPLVTVFQIIVRLGALTEHKYNILGPTPEDSTPLIILRWWEKILLPNLNFTYHIYHHAYPNISFDKLPLVHELYKSAGLVREEHVFYGYRSFIRYLMKADNKN